jgi:hypothetical protein
MVNSLETIVSQIVALSLTRNTGDAVRDIYTVMMDLNLKLADIMRQIREQEKEASNA